MILEDASDRRTASRIIEAIGDSGINVIVERYGMSAEGGWLLTAFSEESGERWRIEADRVLDAAVELAGLVGFDLEC